MSFLPSFPRILRVPPAEEHSLFRGFFQHKQGLEGQGGLGDFSRAAKRGGFKRGGASRSGIVLPFLSFFVLFLSLLGLSRIFRDFPDLLGDGSGIFPIRHFSLSRRIQSIYEEQSRKGPRHNLDLSRKKWETPRFRNPPGLALEK